MSDRDDEWSLDLERREDGNPPGDDVFHEAYTQRLWALDLQREVVAQTGRSD
jgi:hypothetical protein